MHKGDVAQVTELQQQLTEAKTGLQHAGEPASEAAAKLQAQLQDAHQALQVSDTCLQLAIQCICRIIHDCIVRLCTQASACARLQAYQAKPLGRICACPRKETPHFCLQCFDWHKWGCRLGTVTLLVQ